MIRRLKKDGFTLLELLAIIAIIGILAALAIPTYSYFVRKSQSTDILLKYDAIRSGLRADMSAGEISDCADIVAANGNANLGEDYANLTLGFEAVSGGNLQGYRPVLAVCASSDRQGDLAVSVAKAAYDEFVLTNTVEQGAVISDSLVSFAVPLTDNDDAICRVPVGGSLTACGAPAAVPTPATINTPVQVTQTPVIAPTPLAQSTPQPLAAMSESVSTDFSQPSLGGASHIFVDPSVWGWKTDNPDGKVEYGRGSTYGDTSGSNVGIVELEGYANNPSNLYREIATQPGAQYKFSFDLSGRVGVSSQSAAVEIIWEGQVIDTLYPAGNTFGFVHREYDLTATQAGSRIEMRAVTQDGSGPIVDNLEMAYQGMAP